MSEQGWISVHRQLKNHWIWQDPVKLKWWLDILLSANHSPAKVNIGNDLIECSRGQCVKSLQTWAYEWRTSKDTVRNFFKLLEKDKMISTESVKVSTRLTICNYDSYQSSLHGKQTAAEQQANASQTQTHPNNNVNNEINDNNENNIHPDACASNKNVSLFPEVPLESKPAKPKRTAKPKKDKEPKGLHQLAIKNFTDFYYQKFNTKYSFSGAKDGVAVQQLLDKITEKTKELKITPTEENILNGFEHFIRSISNQWVVDNFTLSIINSKFNELFINAKNGNSTSSTYQAGLNHIINKYIPQPEADTSYSFAS